MMPFFQAKAILKIFNIETWKYPNKDDLKIINIHVSIFLASTVIFVACELVIVKILIINK